MKVKVFFSFFPRGIFNAGGGIIIFCVLFFIQRMSILWGQEERLALHAAFFY